MAKKQQEDENSNTSPRLRAHKRRQGQRPSPEEKREAKEAFLRAFALTANVRASCQSAGIDRKTIYEWKEHDEQFLYRFQQAELDAADVIRGEIFRRGITGWDEPALSMGKQVYNPDGTPLMVRRYDSNLLQSLAKARLPEYRDKAEISLKADVTTTSSRADELRMLTDEQLKVYESWLLSAKAKRQREE